jgi:hypothetical protein
MEHKLIPPTSLDMQALISMASVRLVVNHMAAALFAAAAGAEAADAEQAFDDVEDEEDDDSDDE